MKTHPFSASCQRRRTFLKRPARILGLLVCAALCGPLAHAAEVYAYLGSNFTTVSGIYTTSDYVSGEFTTLTPLDPNLVNQSITPASYSFSNGVFDWTDANSSFFPWYPLLATTDAYGTLLSASFELTSTYGPPWTASLGGFSYGNGILLVSSAGDESYTHTNGTAPAALYDGDGASVQVGKWGPDFDPIDTPEPATPHLTLSAFLAVALLARKRIAPGPRQPTSIHHC
jgi:hypothetical protein